MAVEAPVSKYKKNNCKIAVFGCLIFAALLAYDGYLSKYEWSHRRSFYEKNVKDGKPTDTMVFNRIAPLFLVAGAVAFAIRLPYIKKRKIVAGENELIINGRQKIIYDSVEKIDKTNFSKKGYFVITYKDNNCKLKRTLSTRNYDNLAAVLDVLIGKIT